jgi:hypothetical protein
MALTESRNHVVTDSDKKFDTRLFGRRKHGGSPMDVHYDDRACRELYIETRWRSKCEIHSLSICLAQASHSENSKIRVIL